MTLFSGQIYGGIGQMGAHNKVAAATGVAAWLYGDYGGSGGARIDAANCIAAYCPIGAADLTASYVNLANPGTNNIVEVVRPGFSASSGWTFDGISQRLNSTINPVGTNKQYSVIVRYSNYNLAVTGRAILGGWTSSSASLAIYVGDSSTLVFFSSGQRVVYMPVSDYGVLAISGNQGYYNSLAVGIPIPDGGALADSQICIGGMRVSGEGWLSQCYVQAAWFYNAVFTVQQIAGLTGAINALTSAGNYYLQE